MHPLGRKISILMLLKLALILGFIYAFKSYKFKPTPEQVAEQLLPHNREKEGLEL